MEELKLEIEKLKSEIETMKKAQDLNQNKLLFDSFINNGLVTSTSTGAYGSDLQRTITISSTPSAFTVPEDPIGSATVKIGQTFYRILLYSLT